MTRVPRGPDRDPGSVPIQKERPFSIIAEGKKGLQIEIKEDKSPVSNGDLKVNELITNKIKDLTPNIPIVSEETVDLNKKNERA